MGPISELLYGLVIATTLGAECLVIAWSATSDRPRLLRALIVWVAIALLIPIRAYLPALVLTMTAALTWKLVAVIGRWQRMPPSTSEPATVWWRFQLGDVFVLILFVATVAALFRQFPHFRFMAILYLPVLGLPLAPILALSHFAVAGRARVRTTIALVLVIAAAAAGLVLLELSPHLDVPWLIRAQGYHAAQQRQEVALSIYLVVSLVACLALMEWLVRQLWARPPEQWKRPAYGLSLVVTASLTVLTAYRFIDDLFVVVSWESGPEFLWIGLHAIPLAGLALLVAFQAWLNGGGDSPEKLRRVARWITVAIAALVAVPLAWVYWEMIRPLPFPPPRVVGENHYDRIEAICLELGAPSARGFSFNNDTTRTLVYEAVTLLEAPNFLPASALEEDAGPTYARRARDLHALPIHFEAAAEFASYPGNFDHAADYGLAGLRYGEIFHRGGTARYASLGSAWQRQSLQWLAEHRDHVSPAKAREVVQAIEQAFSQRDDYETLEIRDRIYWERMGGWMGRLKYRLAEWFPHKLPGNSLRDEYLASSASLRGLQTVFAIRLFKEDRDRLPQLLDELTPEFLAAVPLDPYSQRPLIYRAVVNDFELYSVGQDRIDNGGRFDALNYYRDPGFDLDLSQKVQ